MLRGSRRTAALLAMVLVASPALADRKPPSEKDKQFAGDLVKRAIAKSKAGDHDAAIAIYQQAYATVASSALLSNIGSEYQQVGKPKEALRYFCMYLEKDPVGANAPFAIAQAKLLQSQITNREVDDAELCAAPRVEPTEPPAPPVAPPRTDIVEQPPALTPEVVKSNGNPRLRYAGIGAGAAGLVAAGLGVYYGTQAKKISDEISAHSTDAFWDKIQQRQAEGQHDENLQIGFLVAGGALITTGVILYVLGRPSAASADQTAIHVAPTTNGFAVFGGF